MTFFIENRHLLQAFREGDERALTAVYQHYIGDIEAFAIHRTPDFESCKDLVQEIFIRAFKKRARIAYDGVRPYRPYLLQIARSAIIDSMRRRSRSALDLAIWTMPRHGDRPELKAISNCADGPEQPVQSQVTEEDLHWHRLTVACANYCEKLDADQRDIVSLRYEQQIPQTEVATRLGLTRWRVRALEKKITNGLWRYLKKEKLLTNEPLNPSGEKEVRRHVDAAILAPGRPQRGVSR